MSNDKQLLRAWLKTRRLAMEKAEVERLSSIIQARLIKSVNWQGVKTIHCYQAIDSLNEIKTVEIIDFIKRKQPSIELVLQTRRPGEIPVGRFDLVIVPVLGFSATGHRLGWGGGFYDGFLAGQPSTLKIGLAYEFSKLIRLPIEPHDVPLDVIVTEAAEYGRKAHKN